MNAVTVTTNECMVWSRYIHAICGIYLDVSKAYLLTTRFGELIRETGAASLSELYYKAKFDSPNGLRRKIIDVITTQETSFFRDELPFNLLRNKLIPDLVHRRRRLVNGRIPIRIWSAACSTGQEPYSIGIVIKEVLGDLRGYDIQIFGTDISDAAIIKARRGWYSRHEIDRGISDDKLERHFVQADDGWKIKEEIRALTTFKTMNLFEPCDFDHKFDLIFCRNVAIYFTPQDRGRLFLNIGKTLNRDGRLIIGVTETISDLGPEFKAKRFQRAAYYELKET